MHILRQPLNQNRTSNCNSNINYIGLTTNNPALAIKLLSFEVRNSFLICNVWKLVILVPPPMRFGSDTSYDGTAKLKL